jgi:hypothetical protein
MRLEFGKQPSEGRRRPQPPPDYLSRRVQWKVFVMVACLMLVFILMQEARRPENWRWMWAMQDSAASLDDTFSGQDVDTRLRMPTETTDSGQAPGDVLIQGTGDPTRARPVTTPPRPDEPASEQHDPLQHARHDAWTRLLGDLEPPQRTGFLRGLKAARNTVPLQDEDRPAWPAIVDVLDSGWQEYLDQAFLAVSQDQGRLTDDEKRDWLEVVQRLGEHWQKQVKPVLQAVGSGEPLDAAQQQTLRDLQATLDRVFLDEIQDNTVFRPDEKDAWFRLFEQLQSRDVDSLQAASTGHVGFLQLYRQPDAYRGRLVTVDGTIRLGYYRSAPGNFYGIDGYYIFWLKPTGSNSPIVVYSLDVPPGFPDVVRMERGGDKPELDEQVQFTGYFFKRWAYRAEDGTRLAPLLLARSPRWEAPAEPSGQSAELPGPWFWTALIGGTFLFGVAAAAFVYWTSRRARQPASTVLARHGAGPQDLPPAIDKVHSQE